MDAGRSKTLSTPNVASIAQAPRANGTASLTSVSEYGSSTIEPGSGDGSPIADVPTRHLDARAPTRDPRGDVGRRARAIGDLPAEHGTDVRHVGPAEGAAKISANAWYDGTAAQLPTSATHVEVRRTPDELEIRQPQDHAGDVRAIGSRFSTQVEYPGVNVSHGGAKLDLVTHALRLQTRIRADQHAFMEELIGERRRRVRASGKRGRAIPGRATAVSPARGDSVAPSIRESQSSRALTSAATLRRAPHIARRTNVRPHAGQILAAWCSRRERRRRDVERPRLGADGGRPECRRGRRRNGQPRAVRVNDVVVRNAERRRRIGEQRMLVREIRVGRPSEMPGKPPAVEPAGDSRFLLSSGRRRLHDRARQPARRRLPFAAELQRAVVAVERTGGENVSGANARVDSLRRAAAAYVGNRIREVAADVAVVACHRPAEPQRIRRTSSSNGHPGVSFAPRADRRRARHVAVAATRVDEHDAGESAPAVARRLRARYDCHTLDRLERNARQIRLARDRRVDRHTVDDDEHFVGARSTDGDVARRGGPAGLRDDHARYGLQKLAEIAAARTFDGASVERATTRRIARRENDDRIERRHEWLQRDIECHRSSVRHFDIGIVDGITDCANSDGEAPWIEPAYDEGAVDPRQSPLGFGRRPRSARARSPRRSRRR